MASAVERSVAWESMPTIGGDSAASARTTDRTDDARPRSSPGTTSDTSASAGATGMVRKRLPKKRQTEATASELVRNAGRRNTLASTDAAAVTCTRALTSPRRRRRSATSPPAISPSTAPAPITGAKAPALVALRSKARLKNSMPQ